ncbi:glycosyltransferase family 4 protein [Sphingobium sp. D43FB]|uniref:glycosyltransferase family 4 protein n=1 Tax=Sphingobium sp. D43FB TaxID=2017595 RepID=UPI000BB59993|nr:glycosyltransferase family 4 protein [Sphingobium sp. D43FB]PBN41619.1 hypothetical protein SxD43FB_20775 [Sphingobium sp. D43FB]
MKLLFIDFTIPHLFDDADYPVGGWAVELRAWLAGFRAIGVDTAIITTENASQNAERSEQVALLRAYADRGRIPGANYLFRFLPRMLAFGRSWRPDFVVQAVAGINTGLMYLLARYLRVPFIYRCANDIDVDERVEKRLGVMALRLYRLGLKNADGFVAQNGYQLSRIQQLYPGKRAIVLHNPYQQMNSGPSLPRGERHYVAWLGIFQPQKNLPLLARIAYALPDVEFRIGGKLEIGMNDKTTVDAIAVLEALPNVKMVGYLRRTKVPDFLSKAIMLLSTSHYEGFSNTFLESWGAGTPIVASRAVDPDSLIETRGLGRVAADPEALAQVVRETAALSEADYAAMSGRCRAHANTEHDPVHLSAKLRDFMEHVRAEV